jgi:phenylalanyl-tRNA synthetase alpha chain
MEQEEKQGHYHPLTLVNRDMLTIFNKMGFEVVTGPEIDSEHYNFNMLNVPPDHPAREMQDTFWLEKDKGGERMLLRTQTSNMQIRYMEEHKPPLRIISPGKVYRNEATDARHEAVFHQIEGLVVDTDITLAHLKGTLEQALGELFGGKTEIRMRPGYFPFVEPGVEIDATCFRCSGKDSSCRLCNGSGWIELMGAGMVHPKVLSNVGIHPRKYQGFAFGVGVERLAMVKYGIEDIRVFLSGDARVVDQF